MHPCIYMKKSLFLYNICNICKVVVLVTVVVAVALVKVVVVAAVVFARVVVIAAVPLVKVVVVTVCIKATSDECSAVLDAQVGWPRSWTQRTQARQRAKKVHLSQVGFMLASR